MNDTMKLVAQLKQAGEDAEFYPTTDEMISAVRRWIPEDALSIMDIGAGDGRVLRALGEKTKNALLYSIELSSILIEKQPKNIIPVGTDLFQQRLAALQVDYIVSNPPYKQYVEWVCKIVEEGFAKKAFLIIPQRWSLDKEIERALKLRNATTRVIFSGDFLDGERRARAIVDIVEISFPRTDTGWRDTVKDPFDIWFDQNIDTFDKAEEIEEDEAGKDLAKRYAHASIDEIVAAYMEEYSLLESNYRAIFKLDLQILQELGINKDAVREGLKTKMKGLKAKYWGILFERLDAITSRLTTASKKLLLEKLTANTSVEFTASNAYAVVLWAIKNANQYFEEQLITLFRELSTFEGVMAYKSNQTAWGQDHWRYMRWNEWAAFHPGNGDKPKVNYYSLDYRIVVERYGAIKNEKRDPWGSSWEYPGNLKRTCHELIADVVAVMNNLGFRTDSLSSFDRQWVGGQWQDWYDDKGNILFQAKAYMNGNVHFRFNPEAIKALNIEAGRLLKWVRTAEEVVTEMGYSPADAKKYFMRNVQLTGSNVPMLGRGEKPVNESPLVQGASLASIPPGAFRQASF